MKIGIITFYNSQDNYGQILQCFALQQFLRNHGHDPFLIRYLSSSKPTSHIKVNKLFDYITKFPAYFRYAISLINKRRYQQANVGIDRNFKHFIKENITVSDQIYSREELMENPPAADAFICGSDQIWGGEDIYYLPFAPEDTPKIAYAPSFGGIDHFTPDTGQRIKTFVSRLDFIGMREHSGVETLRTLGINKAIQVVDPTLLLEKEDYLGFIGPARNIETTNDNNCFVYLLGNEISCTVTKIIKYIKRQGMTYTYVASQGRADRYNKFGATIIQWIDQIRHSKLVITNSYHCIVFALIFHRPFISIPLSGSYSRMNDRVDDLLGRCFMKERIFTGDFLDVPSEIDFSGFENFKMQETLRCGKLLLDNLVSK